MSKKKLLPLIIDLVFKIELKNWILNHYMCLLCYELFSVLENITMLLFEQKKPIIKILLKDKSK